MADLERTYVVPLRKEWLKAPKYRRSKKAINALREFLVKHMKSDDVKIMKELNEEVWKDGIKNPPGKIKVNVLKNKEGIVYAQLFGKKIDLKKDEKKEAKKVEAKKEETVEEKKSAKKTETKKTEAKKETKTEEKKTETKKEEKPEVKEVKTEKKEEKPVEKKETKEAEAKKEVKTEAKKEETKSEEKKTEKAETKPAQ